MSQTPALHPVTITVVMRGTYAHQVQNPMTRCVSLLSALEEGGVDWYAVAKDAYRDVPTGGQVAFTVTWKCGHALWALFDCVRPDKPAVAALYLTDDDSVPIGCEGAGGLIYASIFVTNNTEVDYSHGDVLASFARRLAEKGFDIIAPNMDYGPCIVSAIAQAFPESVAYGTVRPRRAEDN